MGVWEFVVVYLAAFVLVQLAIYRYLRGRGDEGAPMPFAGPPNADRGPSGDRRTGDDADHMSPDPRDRRHPPDPVDRRIHGEQAGHGGGDPVRRCPSCGAENEPDGPYTFCRNCASRLPG